ncbi:MAG: DUF429 domain-containing protein [Anaerolineaceae bacterium]|nr:DUF429 domain-containing protein [Anaerolineaceae bacterium]
MVCIGVYPAPQPGKGRGLLTYAALDQNLKLLALSQGSAEDLKAYASGQSTAVTAINSPRRPSLSLPQINPQAGFFPETSPVKKVRGRMADRQLREHNLGHPVTPNSEELCPAWMRHGFRLFDRFKSLGYQDYPEESGPFQLMEVYTQATFTLLCGEPPLPRKSLEGRLQRQLLLNDKDIDIPDPMRFFEEVTRYRLRNGILPLKEVYLPAELDALAAAYTAWLAVTNPQSVMLYGDEREGQVVVPVGLMLPKLAHIDQIAPEYAHLDND